MEIKETKKRGRPFGTTKEITRKGRNIRATDEEWEIIYEFAKIVKTYPNKGQQIMNYGRTLLKGFREKAENID